MAESDKEMAMNIDQMIKNYKRKTASAKSEPRQTPIKDRHNDEHKPETVVTAPEPPPLKKVKLSEEKTQETVAPLNANVPPPQTPRKINKQAIIDKHIEIIRRGRAWIETINSTTTLAQATSTIETMQRSCDELWALRHFSYSEKSQFIQTFNEILQDLQKILK